MSNKTVKVTINNKNRIGFTDGALKFSTRSGKRRFFNIPHSEIIDRKISEIKQNDVHSEAAVEYELTPWIYNRIKEDLKTMKDFDVILPKT